MFVELKARDNLGCSQSIRCFLSLSQKIQCSHIRVQAESRSRPVTWRCKYRIWLDRSLKASTMSRDKLPTYLYCFGSHRRHSVTAVLKADCRLCHCVLYSVIWPDVSWLLKNLIIDQGNGHSYLQMYNQSLTDFSINDGVSSGIYNGIYSYKSRLRKQITGELLHDDPVFVPYL